MLQKALCVFMATLFLSAGQATSVLALDTQQAVSLEMAKRMADACEAKAKQEGWNLSIAVVDPGANLILFRRMPNAYLVSIDIALNKARTSAPAAVPHAAARDDRLWRGREGGSDTWSCPY